MSILNILEFPDPRLRTIAAPVKQVDVRIQHIVDDMFETMYHANGIGLAATQVDVHEQIIVMDISEQRNEPRVFINPEIEILDPNTKRAWDEGCLSVPGFYESVERPEHIHVRALDREGNTTEFQPDGLMAICLQHEIDHLNGKLFVDYLSPLKRQRIRQKLEKAHRQQA